MTKDYNTIVVNQDIFSIDDAREAAKQLFETQVDDFNKLKNEKWYKHLLNAVTFGADRKKKVIKDIRSLSKLQTIFMKVYCENYKGLDSQLNEIIEGVSKTNESVKKIYVKYIVGINSQQSVLELSALEQDILLLLLCAYSSNNGNEETLKKYRAGVAQTIGRGIPQGEFKPEMLEQINATEIFYRFIVEMCAIDDCLDDFSIPENVYDAIGYLSISPRAKDSIEKLVRNELNTLGLDYLITKYGVAEEDLLDDDVELIDEGEIESVAEEFLDETDVEMTDENITSILQIGKGEVKEYRYKNIHLSAYIKCEGELIFKHCTIYYNESDARDEILLAENAKLSIVDSEVICKGMDENSFITCEGKNIIEFKNTSFEDCSYFLDTKYFYVSSFIMDNCRIHNCYKGFVHISIREDAICKLTANIIIQDNLAVFHKGRGYFDLISIWGTSKDDDVSENIVIEKESFRIAGRKEKEEYNAITYFRFSKLNVKKCSFYGITSPIHVKDISECRFENCDSAIDAEESSIDNCIFVNCTNIIDVGNGTKITNCRFDSCYNRLIFSSYVRSGICVEYCQFSNIKNLPSNNAWAGMEEHLSCIIFGRTKERHSKANYITNCIFDGISIDKNFLIAATGYEKPYDTVTYIENCDFRNCETRRASGQIIKEYMQYDNLFRKPQKFHANIVKNCTGLDRINKDGSQANTIDTRMVSILGKNIGSSRNITDVM